jgi:hypothetical protein
MLFGEGFGCRLVLLVLAVVVQVVLVVLVPLVSQLQVEQ